ncbi:hypothetical protein [Vibrio maerlii]|uniref:hypothetical protein n=1 Tax=Vibrio maerlii TaxID=2231648 RepID=UPI000E3C8D75|nr:hypothetical protein [Vibrio maerlii]
MKRDCFGICLNSSVLHDHLRTTFTHVRAYRSAEPISDDLKVQYTFSQITGQDLLSAMKTTPSLIWRAEYHCPNLH